MATAGTNDLAGINSEVVRLHRAGELRAAKLLAERALQDAETALGPDHPDVGVSLNNLAGLYHEQGRYADAEPLLKRALAIWEKALGPGHPNVASSLDNLAVLYLTQGRHDDAEPLFKRALAIRERALPPDHADIGTSLNNLAGLYCEQGRDGEAEQLHERSLSIRERALGPHHPAVGNSLNNLAFLCKSQGRYDDAERLYKRALATWEKAVGPDHADIGTSLNNLALLHEAQGRYAEAEPLLKRALSIREKALGADHPAVGTSLNNLALLYESQGRYADAEPLYERALSITENALGRDHPNVGASLNNLAGLYCEQGRYGAAEPLHRRALSITENALGRDHPNVGASLGNFALLYESQGRYADAEPLYERALSITENALGPDHPDVATSLNNLAGLYREQGRYADAEPLYKRALAIRQKTLGSDHPDVGTSLNNLAALYTAQGRYAEAVPLFKRAEEIPGWEVADIPILFATNRTAEPIAEWTSFSARQETDISRISFGKAIVRAPKPEVLHRADRFAGALGQRDRVLGRQASVSFLTLRKVELDPSGTALSTVARDRLSRAARFPKQAFVFVHGYNTSFEDAVRRTAMIAFDLDFDGATFLFTWPSHAKLSAYRTDRKRARVAAPFLLELFHRIGAQLPDVELHVLAHSTGAEIALSALTALAERSEPTSRPRPGELILAHADVDPARLGRAMPGLRKLGIGVTSYSSAIDWAMHLSRAIRFLTRSRVGAGPVHIDGVDSIDITGLSGGPLEVNHTVFVDNPMVFGDIHRLMATGERPPNKRTASFVPVKTPRGAHWIYKSSTSN